MSSNDIPDQEMERTLEIYFQAEAARLHAPAGLWERIEGRLAEQSDPEGHAPRWHKVFMPRRWGLLPAFVTTMLLLLAVSGAWLFTESPWDDGLPAAPTPTRTQTPTGGPTSAATPTPTPAPRAAPTPAPGAPQAGSNAFSTSDGTPNLQVRIIRPGALDTAQRQVISQASVSIESEEVPAAVVQVRAIAERLGGFVEQLSSSGGPERQQSTITIRVPQQEFFTALESIKTLGKVRSEDAGSEDVTERFIDLEARLRSALREEESLLSLLERADQVSEILTIERELSRVRSDIERDQGQLNFLERRVDLSTITVSLFPPDAEVAEPPSGSLTIEVSNVSGSVDEVKALVSRVDGELDLVFVTVRDGKESSDMTLRVFSKDFEQVLSSVEAQGKVRTKEIRERAAPVEAETMPPEKPDSRIDVSFVEKDSSVAGRIIVIGASLGGAVVIAVLGGMYYVAYRAGRRRGSLA